MKKSAQILFTLFLFFSVSILVTAQTNWVGEYSFDEDGGETVGGTKIFVAHTLKIKKTGKNLTAHLYSQGYQTSKDIYADVKTDGNKLMLFYRDKGKDHYLGDYKKGDHLLTLEKKLIDGKTQILTYWEKFKPIVPANEKSGEVYFKMVKDNKTVSLKKEVRL